MTVSAIDAMARACFASFARLPNARILDERGAFGALTDVPVTFFNGIGEARVHRDDVPQLIAAFGARPFRWWISPASEPHDLRNVLREHGMEHRYDAPGMAADLTTYRHEPAPRELTIERLAGRMQPWLDVFLACFEKSEDERATWLGAYEHCDASWIHFAGFVDGVPVATTSLLLAGDLCGVYHVATLPRYRGRGIGAAMTRAAMRTARDAGAHTATLQSSELGESVYRSVGFKAACTLTLFDRR